MGREAAMMSVVFGCVCLTVLTLLTCSSACRSVAPKPVTVFSWPLRREREANQQQQQLNTSALNTALAFGPYHALATRTAAEPGVQQQQQRNILFSPLGLASALTLLCRVSGSDSRSQVLEALGMASNSTEQSVEATISALTDLQRSLTLQEAESEGGARTDAGIGGATEGVDAGHRADAGDGEGNKTGTEDGGHAGGQLKVWSSLHVDGKPSLDYENFLSTPGPAAFNTSFETLIKNLQDSDKLTLNNYVYFKGLQPFERHHTVLRNFHLNATTSVEVAMMFRDDSSAMTMLYDTNCSATVVRLAHSRRLASLLLLPKAELQPLEDCLSDSRMSFWLSNLKPGRAEIRFPRFQLRKSYSLESLLRNAGVSSVFSQSADFSVISQKKTLKLIKAPHEVMLEVEETKSEDRGRPDIMLDFSIPPRITFDRPFMLIIYDSLTGLVLLIGRVIDPTDG
ncbi:alpha-1-antiproteinase-like [Brachyistius frenatus]|uniref:alpha-1-antiproteinase-like n=1 Tax=Brachyistius frenatus TaxID=100188 RepID=UPI0037E820E5